MLNQTKYKKRINVPEQQQSREVLKNNLNFNTEERKWNRIVYKYFTLFISL